MSHRVLSAEFCAVRGPNTITTSLGSCVAVALCDLQSQVYGINHFMLPEPTPMHSPISLNARYGTHAMELLINKLMALGGDRSRLTASVYGGAQMLWGSSDIGRMNIDFALQFLTRENIQITHQDTGGRATRCLTWDTLNNIIHCKKLDQLRESLDALKAGCPIKEITTLRAF
jgi:chemotaxis protein CheD